MTGSTEPDRVPMRSLPPETTFWTLSHPGYVREQNEDAIACTVPSGAGNSRIDLLALVADGMGGHAAGEVASQIAADTVVRLSGELDGSPPEILERCLTAANAAILERGASDSACAGMGTTCTVLALSQGQVFLAHVGDTRAYLLRDGALRQISEDDSLVAEMVRKGLLNEQQARNSPGRNAILRVLGVEGSLKLTVWETGLPVCAGDIFLLSSDGLTNLVDDAAIAAIAARLPPRDACEALCQAALAAGGTDNVSICIFRIGGSRNGPATEENGTRG